MPATTLRFSDLRFLLALLLPALTTLSVLAHPELAAAWALAILLTIALVDVAWPGRGHSPGAGADHPALRWLLRLYVPLQTAMIGAGIWVASQADSGWTLASVVYAVGFVSGAQGITFAHELGHSKQRADRALAWWLMASVGYAHFMVEHYRGHHVRAATWPDPASARRGESLWRFLPRTLLGSLTSGWRLEAQRLRRQHRGWVRSPLMWVAACTLACLGAALWLGQGLAVLFWLGQSALAVFLLEVINYIEHYGLQRRVNEQGRPEPFGLAHAWNADHIASNSVLANLQRHSDHHMHAWKPYPTLEAVPGPQLPTGYAGCLLLACVPPLWFALIHPRLDRLSAPGLG